MKEFNNNSQCVYVAKAINDKKTGMVYAHIVDDDCNEFIFAGFDHFFITGYYKTADFLNGAIKEYDFEEWSKIVDRYIDHYDVVMVNVKIIA